MIQHGSALDARLQQRAPQPNGAGDHFFAGTTDAGVRRRALIAFDVDGSLPPGSTVDALTPYLPRPAAARERGCPGPYGRRHVDCGCGCELPRRNDMPLAPRVAALVWPVIVGRRRDSRRDGSRR